MAKHSCTDWCKMKTKEHLRNVQQLLRSPLQVHVASDTRKYPTGGLQDPRSCRQKDKSLEFPSDFRWEMLQPGAARSICCLCWNWSAKSAGLSWRDPANGKIKELHVITIWCNYIIIQWLLGSMNSSLEFEKSAQCRALRCNATCHDLSTPWTEHPGARRQEMRYHTGKALQD